MSKSTAITAKSDHTIVLTPKQLLPILSRYLEARNSGLPPIFIWGPPGIGKTEIVKTAASNAKRAVNVIHPVTMDPVDVAGLPVTKDDTVNWSRPHFIPADPYDTSVLFIDELPQAAPLVQAALLNLLHADSRRCGTHTLPEGTAIICAGNRQEDRAGTHRMITPLLNRVMHFELAVSHEEWREWALQAGISGDVRSFLDFRPNLLHLFDPSKGALAFPTPRSWSNLSRALAIATPDTTYQIAAGLVGEGPALEFDGYLKTYRELPDIEGIFKNPEKAEVPSEKAVLWATMGAIVDRVFKAKKDLKPKNGITVVGYASKALLYATRLPAEFAICLGRDVLQLYPLAVSEKEYGAFYSAHGKYLKQSA